MLIANFIGPKPKLGFLEPWLEALNSEIKQSTVTFNHKLAMVSFIVSVTHQTQPNNPPFTMILTHLYFILGPNF